MFSFIENRLKRVYHATLNAIDESLMYLFVAFSYLFLSQKTQILEIHNGTRTSSGSKRVCVYVHFDKKGLVADYVLFYIQELVRVGFDVIFVSNSPKLDAGSLAKLMPFCAKVVRRRNRGHDFGAYKDGISLLNLEDLDQLILANDSVYGPLFDLKDTIEKCHSGIPMWGMTDNWAIRYHLQSYFLLFHREALLNPRFSKFWKDLIFVQSRAWVIRKYEIGLTQNMLQSGIRSKALFPFREISQKIVDSVLSGGILKRQDLEDHHRNYLQFLFRAIESGLPLNSTHYLWDYLITDLGCPFIKRDLLVLNKFSVPYVGQWQTIVRRSSNYDPDLILRHLETIARNRAV